MRLHYYGHAAFLIEASDGRRVIIDPYGAGRYGESFRYAPIDDSGDLVLASHQHHDHFDPDAVAGDPVTLSKPGLHRAVGFKLVGVETAHDPRGGSERGRNVVWRFTVDGLKCAHLGDLGEQLSDSQAGAIGAVDVLMVPVGGHFTLDAAGARAVMRRLARHVVVPMHYRTEKVDFPIAGVEPFLEGADPVVRPGGPDLVLSAGELPPEPTIYVLEPSR